jgi:hypothetical protein
MHVQPFQNDDLQRRPTLRALIFPSLSHTLAIDLYTCSLSLSSQSPFLLLFLCTGTATAIVMIFAVMLEDDDKPEELEELLLLELLQLLSQSLLSLLALLPPLITFTLLLLLH